MIQLNCDMPTSCQECRFSVDGWCYALRAEETQPGQLNYLTRPEWCPFRDAAPRWVRCEEEMPKEMKVVVTYGKGRVSFGYCMFLYDADMEKDVCEWVDTHSNRMEVTHWMPLPEPPKEDA